MNLKLLLFLAVSSYATMSYSQDTPILMDSTSYNAADTTTVMELDSMPSLFGNADSVVKKKGEGKAKKKKSRAFKGPLSMFAGNPGRAALYSLVIPGAGQFYNKKYWKIPLVLAAEGAAIGVLIFNVDRFNAWDRALREELEDPSSHDRTAQEIIAVRDQARKQRDYSIVAVTLVHIIQIADAFVHRHLIEFDVSDDLSIDVGTPAHLPGIGLTYTF